MDYSNTDKLAAVVARWLSPMADQLVGLKLNSLPFLANLEAKIKATGWVGAEYSIMQDLGPLIRPVVDSMLAPAITSMLSGVPDEAIPQAAHRIADAAISSGGISILDGKVSFSAADMAQLKHLLDLNLPACDSGFQVEE